MNGVPPPSCDKQQSLKMFILCISHLSFVIDARDVPGTIGGVYKAFSVIKAC